jgi:hypothetical protein
MQSRIVSTKLLHTNYCNIIKTDAFFFAKSFLVFTKGYFRILNSGDVAFILSKYFNGIHYMKCWFLYFPTPCSTFGFKKESKWRNWAWWHISVFNSNTPEAEAGRL